MEKVCFRQKIPVTNMGTGMGPIAMVVCNQRLQDIQGGECLINVLLTRLNVLLLKCSADMQIPIAEFVHLINPFPTPLIGQIIKNQHSPRLKPWGVSTHSYW